MIEILFDVPSSAGGGIVVLLLEEEEDGEFNSLLFPLSLEADRSSLSSRDELSLAKGVLLTPSTPEARSESEEVRRFLFLVEKEPTRASFFGWCCWWWLLVLSIPMPAAVPVRGATTLKKSLPSSC